MTKRLARSSEILDRADSFEDKMNHILFHTEQNARIWAPRVEGEWYPGDPLNVHPYLSQFGGAARPIIQEFDIEYFHMYNGTVIETYYMAECDECEVFWEQSLPERQPCWNCGVWPEGAMGPNRALTTKMMIDSRWLVERLPEPLGYIDEVNLDENGVTFTGHVNPNFDAFAEAARNAGRAMVDFRISVDDYMRPVIAEIQRNLREEYDRIVQRALYGENHLHFDIARPPEPNHIHRYVPPPRVPTVFEEPDIRGPLYDTAALYDPLEGRGVPEPLFRTDDEWAARRILGNALYGRDLNAPREIEAPQIRIETREWMTDSRRPDQIPINQQRRRS